MSQEKPLNLNARVKKTSHEFGEVELLNVSRKATPEQIKKFLILYAEVCPDAFRWSTSVDPPAAVYAPSTQPEPKLGVGDRIKQKLNEANNNSATLASAKKALQEKQATEPLPPPKVVEEIPEKPTPSPVLVQPPKPDTLIYRIILYLRDNPGSTYGDIARAMSDGPNGHWDQVCNTMDSFMHFFVQKVARGEDGRHTYHYSLIPELLAAITPAQQPEEPKPIDSPTVYLPKETTVAYRILSDIAKHPRSAVSDIEKRIPNELGIAGTVVFLFKGGYLDRERVQSRYFQNTTTYVFTAKPEVAQALKSGQPSVRRPKPLFRVSTPRRGSTQWRILEIIKANPRSTVSSVTQVMGMSRTGISSTLNRMLERGFLTREEEPTYNGLKRHHYSISPASEKMLKAEPLPCPITEYVTVAHTSGNANHKGRA